MLAVTRLAKSSRAMTLTGLFLLASLGCGRNEKSDSPAEQVDDPFRKVSGTGSWIDISKVPDSMESVGGMWFVSAWTGDELLVWGGVICAPNVLCSGGARYSTATGWDSMSREGAPEARFDATSVWTGREFLVVGGQTEPPRALRDGGRYDPATDTWTEMPTAGAPLARSQAESVWTGERMVIWGGLSNPQVPDSYLATGATFSPTNSEWSPIAESGAPSGRTRFSMTWTGSEVVVWGGYATDGDGVDTGAAYNPGTDTWRPISSDGAPSGRVDPSALWIGDELFIIGGIRCSPCDTAAYHPETDTWRPISGGPRFGMVGTEAAWGDGVLFTWNGEEVGLDALYRPDTDSWEGVTEDGAPERRAGAHVHWTGDGFLIWGGGASVNSFPRLDGGIFAP